MIFFKNIYIFFISRYESDEKTNAYRKEYAFLEKTYNGLKKDADSLQEELDIANLDPKEAQAKFSARVHEHKEATQACIDRIEVFFFFKNIF